MTACLPMDLMRCCRSPPLQGSGSSTLTRGGSGGWRSPSDTAPATARMRRSSCTAHVTSRSRIAPGSAHCRLTAQQLERLIDDTVLGGKTTIPLLLSSLRRSARRGRPGPALVRSALRPWLAGPVESHLEAEVLRFLIRAGIPEPVRQLEVRTEKQSSPGSISPGHRTTSSSRPTVIATTTGRRSSPTTATAAIASPASVGPCWRRPTRSYGQIRPPSWRRSGSASPLTGLHARSCRRHHVSGLDPPYRMIGSEVDHSAVLAGDVPQRALNEPALQEGHLGRADGADPFPPGGRFDDDCVRLPAAPADPDGRADGRRRTGSRPQAPAAALSSGGRRRS
jgi:hypothetical protein